MINSIRNHVVYRTAKKYGFADYLGCYVSLNQCSESVRFSHGVDRYGMTCFSAVSPKYFVPGNNIVTSVLSLADRTLEKGIS